LLEEGDGDNDEEDEEGEEEGEEEEEDFVISVSLNIFSSISRSLLNEKIEWRVFDDVFGCFNKEVS
jgi:hypothetical protein